MQLGRFGNERTILIGILTAAALLRLAVALGAPAWESPDEYPHYWYAEQIAQTGRLPVSEHVFPAYQAYQPPLYYIVAAAVVAVAPETPAFNAGSQPPANAGLVIVRLLSVLFGVLTVWLTYLIACRLAFPEPIERLGAAAIVALLPTFVGLSATVNNDALVVLLCAGSLAAAMKPNWSNRDAALVGLLFGLAMLTKLNAVVILPVIVWRAYVVRRGLVWLLPGALPAVILLLWRNLAVYGSLLAVNPGVETAVSIDAGHLTQAIRNLSWSFWLAFGRVYQVSLPKVVYLVTALPLMLGAAVGLARTEHTYRRFVRLGVLTVLAAALVSLAYTMAYPPGEMTSWGKNLYPVLPIIGLLLVIGWRRLATGVVVAGLVLLLLGDLWAVWQLAGM